MEPVWGDKQFTKCDYVAEQLKNRIMTGEYKDGDRLPPEPVLCEQFGVSRITVREALKKLNMMGLIDIRQGKGTFVKTVDLSVFMRPMFQKIRFEEVDVEAIYTARAFLEGGTASLAAQNAQEGDLSVLEGILRNLKHYAAVGDLLRAEAFDRDFHIAVARLSRNPILLACVETLEDINSACVRRHNKYLEIMDNCYREHDAVFQAIRDQDPERARAAMVRHAENSKKFLL